ncbi:uncharacterized protein FOMMEDRAFT_83444 [Fomitiporia mediterranea MF3/22]|uniref:uncharacterized protein n=1 Tax=Fomitiporia mediterranea (strain MF3/22) TaxID=694068 RepID=UPI0004408411|nr:uncharacterized protein FOMMEDRAFT_83444 [Fomitiporia mediterranea MF3/22]EJD04571.1 hypothetical protein FOMMEDRAFT_83444 [Fomitiporia mediterranea MF3/22]
MGQFYDSCPQNLLEWIQKQHLFWVATAPLSPDGHVNVSPKGAFDCFHVVGPNKIWYEDYTGSGNETIAHLRENKRITIMFCAFDGPPRIVRLFGTGQVYEYGSPEYNEFIPKETRKPGSRSVIVVDVHKVGSSCGYSIPFYDFRGERTLLFEYAQRVEMKGDPTAPDPRADKGLREYWATHNTKSIDGLPGVTCALDVSDMPTSKWSKEAELARGKEKAAMNRNRRGEVNLVGSKLHSAEMSAKLVAAFTIGVFTALLSVKMSGLIV